MTPAFDADVDSLIGSLQSVYAGDRGHAISDLRDSLFASLGSVALGPPAEPVDAPASPPTSAGASPSLFPPLGVPPALPPARSPSPDTFAPGALSPVSVRSRAGSRAQRNPPPSPTLGRAPRQARLSAQPYATRRPRAHTSQRCSAKSAGSSRQPSPDGAVSAALAELHPAPKPRAQSRSYGRSRSSSSPLAPASFPRGAPTTLASSQMDRGLSCGSRPHLSSSLPKSPPFSARGQGLTLTPMYGAADRLPFQCLPSPSAASSDGFPESVATSAHTSVVDLLPEAAPSKLSSARCCP